MARKREIRLERQEQDEWGLRGRGGRVKFRYHGSKCMKLQIYTDNLDHYAIAEQAYRRCLAILNMASKHGYPVLEKACKIASNLERLSAQEVKVFFAKLNMKTFVAQATFP